MSWNLRFLQQEPCKPKDGEIVTLLSGHTRSCTNTCGLTLAAAVRIEEIEGKTEANGECNKDGVGYRTLKPFPCPPQAAGNHFIIRCPEEVTVAAGQHQGICTYITLVLPFGTSGRIIEIPPSHYSVSSIERLKIFEYTLPAGTSTCLWVCVDNTRGKDITIYRETPLALLVLQKAVKASIATCTEAVDELIKAEIPWLQPALDTENCPEVNGVCISHKE